MFIYSYEYMNSYIHIQTFISSHIFTNILIFSQVRLHVSHEECRPQLQLWNLKLDQPHVGIPIIPPEAVPQEQPEHQGHNGAFPDPIQSGIVSSVVYDRAAQVYEINVNLEPRQKKLLRSMIKVWTEGML